MSWIPCAKHCRHQRDGYCSLDQITPLGTSADEECAYFSRVEDDGHPLRAAQAWARLLTPISSKSVGRSSVFSCFIDARGRMILWNPSR